jgi:hypothetical protein
MAAWARRRAQDRFDAQIRKAALTPLVDRRDELAMLHARWQRAKGGEGQVVLVYRHEVAIADQQS